MTLRESLSADSLLKAFDANPASFIDHTLLLPTATWEDIMAHCADAAAYKFATVCVQPCWVPQARHALDNTGVNVCTVIGFPFGTTTTAAKIAEVNQAIRDGAKELDVVVNLGWVKSGFWEAVAGEILQVRRAVGTQTMKLILETADLTGQEIDRLCQMAKDVGVRFVKTSTGYSKSGGATVEAVQRMAALVGGRGGLGIKASGGVRTLEDAQAMVAAGATRIGTSAGKAIVMAATGERLTAAAPRSPGY